MEGQPVVGSSSFEAQPSIAGGETMRDGPFSPLHSSLSCSQAPSLNCLDCVTQPLLSLYIFLFGTLTYKLRLTLCYQLHSPSLIHYLSGSTPVATAFMTPKVSVELTQTFRTVKNNFMLTWNNHSHVSLTFLCKLCFYVKVILLK